MRAMVQSQRGDDAAFFTKERMRYEIPEEPARRGRTQRQVPRLCLDGPTQKYGCIIPSTKSARP
jgi:hypothetical protein